MQPLLVVSKPDSLPTRSLPSPSFVQLQQSVSAPSCRPVNHEDELEAKASVPYRILQVASAPFPSLEQIDDVHTSSQRPRRRNSDSGEYSLVMDFLSSGHIELLLCEHAVGASEHPPPTLMHPLPERIRAESAGKKGKHPPS